MSNWFRSYGFADVQDKLLVGAYPLDHEDVGMLEWMKIERVLNLVEDDEYDPGVRGEVAAALAAAGIEERRTSFTDYGRLPAAELEVAVGEVLDWLEQGHRVYLHCRAGWQRSAAVAAGVVAIREGVEIEQALDLVCQRKPSADPLPQQREDLRQWWKQRDPSLPARAVEKAVGSATEAEGAAETGDADEADQRAPGAAEWSHAMNAINAIKAAYAIDAAASADTADATSTADATGTADDEPLTSVDEP
jgi:protein-tyrosine phosphatase